MLTRYDEFPVHQSPHPFSEVPITDYSFDDGYYFGVFCPEERLFLYQGMRVNPNTDMIGGYAGILVDGHQYTMRCSRPWRIDCDTHIGPYRYDFVEPFRDVHLQLGRNDSELAFDLHWLGAGPPFQEAHHLATNRGRRTTDQTRYSQPGRAQGTITFRGRTYDVTPDRWFASRDHSWGLYYERAPLAPNPRLLQPPEAPTVGRALRFWTLFATPTLSGFFGVHEAADGSRVEMNDTFGTPFEGRLYRSWDDVVELVDLRHEADLVPGTPLLASARTTLVDADGGEWHQVFEPVAPPWNPFVIGYNAGSWADGGSIATYHGSRDPVLEWDEYDVSSQPYDHVTHDGRTLAGAVGAEYLCRITTTAPDGDVTVGAGQTELFLRAPYQPWGLTA